MRDGDLPALPVVRDDAVVGVLTDLDLVIRLWAPAPQARP
jgi:CBS domain-containing protein